MEVFGIEWRLIDLMENSAIPRSSVAGCGICEASDRPMVACLKDGFEITKCSTCGVGRTVVATFEPEEFYTEDYFNGGVDGAYRDYQGSQATLQREFQGQVEFLKSFLPRGGRLLEIGCAYGFFLQEAKSHFDVYGLEIAQSAVDFCHRSNLPNVKQGVVTEEFLDRFGPFDAVVLLDVIEHIDDVPATMKALVRRLSEGGVVLITTGDWNSPSARITGNRWRLLTPPLHLWFFTPKGLKLLFEGLNCGLEHLSHPWKLVPLELILSQASSMLGIKWRYKLPARIRNLGLPANMFDAMRLVFRKSAS
jgi:SAM-dependent methyltransferase